MTIARGQEVEPARRGSRLWRPYLRPGMTASAAAMGFAVVALVDPNQPGHYPTCPFLTLTGHTCPGCGSLRAMYALAHGDVAGAVARNALVVLSLPVLAWIWVRWVRRCTTGAPRPEPAPGFVLWSFAAVVVGFWVVRNLSIGAVLAP